MKHTLFIVALLIFQVDVLAQEITAATTDIEKFQNRASSLILKEYTDVAETRTLGIQVVKMTLLPEKKETLSAVLISWGTTSIGVFQETGRAYIDADEVDSVIAGIDSMLKIIGGGIPKDYLELELSTRGNLQLTLFPSKTAWNIALERQGHRQYIFQDDLSKIRESLVTAKGKL